MRRSASGTTWMRCHSSSVLAALILAGGGGTACSQSARVPDGRAAVRAVLSSLSIDSLCAGACSYVALDPHVRSVAAPFVVRPVGAPSALLLVEQDLALVRGLRGILITDINSQPYFTTDTAVMAFYTVAGPDSSSIAQIALLFVPPGSAMRTWLWTPHQVEGTWEAGKPELYYEP